jgi:hypothetical protein
VENLKLQNNLQDQRKWEVNTAMDLKVRRVDVKWIRLAQDTE